MTVRLNLTELNRELMLGENKKDFLRSIEALTPNMNF